MSADNVVTLIPASELAPGMIQVRLEDTGDLVWVHANDLEENKEVIFHPPFEGELKEAIEFIQQSLQPVYPKTYAEWESGFRRDTNPVQQIGDWVHLSSIYNDFVEQNKPTAAVTADGFKLLVACSISSPDTVFEIFRPKLLSRVAAQKLVHAFFNPE